MTDNKIGHQNQNKEKTGEMRIEVQRAYARRHEVPLPEALNLSFLFTVLLFVLYVIEKYQ
jgi:hypothetical protein